MATVTGMTAAAMQAIQDGMIVAAAFDSANHLILTKHDGTTVDAGALGAATTTLAGPVELATNAETQSGSATNLAVTPAGLASLPGFRTQLLAQNSLAESDTPSSWPYGVTLMPLATGSGWTPNSGVGMVVTYSFDSTHTVQDFYANVGSGSPKVWTRSYNSTWSSWAQKMIMVNLTPASFVQTTTRGNYPVGQSRLYYVDSTAAAGWDFASLAPGEVITYAENDNTFGRQVFTQHAGGSTNPVQWFRTANAAGGWTAWQKVVTDPGAWITWTPTWSTTSGLHLPTFGNATTNFKATKLGRKVDVQFDVTFGSTTNFGSGATTTDNWTFSTPAAWPISSNSPGTFLGIGDMYRSSTNLGFTRIKYNSSSSISFGILTTFISGALGGGIGGDVDSVTPWTWASGDAIRGTFSYESTV